MIPLKLFKKYSLKVENSVCEIIQKQGFSTGFFCKIPYKEDNKYLLPVLITSNHGLKLNEIKINEIKIVLNGENKTIFLKNRKQWTDAYMDYAIIEIKENEDNIHNFLDLDDYVFENNCTNKYYLGQEVVIFGIDKNTRQLAYSSGIIKRCYDYYFSYNSITYKGCSGGCIINKSNGKVIGFHKGCTEGGKNDNKKIGIFLMDVIKDIKEIKNGLLSNVKYY